MVNKIPRLKTTWSFSTSGFFPHQEFHWVDNTLLAPWPRVQITYGIQPSLEVEVTPIEYAPWTPLGNPIIWELFAKSPYWDFMRNLKAASWWNFQPVSPYAFYTLYPNFWPGNWLGYR